MQWNHCPYHVICYIMSIVNDTLIPTVRKRNYLTKMLRTWRYFYDANFTNNQVWKGYCCHWRKFVKYSYASHQVVTLPHCVPWNDSDCQWHVILFLAGWIRICLHHWVWEDSSYVWIPRKTWFYYGQISIETETYSYTGAFIHGSVNLNGWVCNCFFIQKSRIMYFYISHYWSNNTIVIMSYGPCCGQLWVWHIVCGQTCDGLRNRPHLS